MRNSNIALTGALIAFTWLVGSAQAAAVALPDGMRAAADHPNILQATHMWQGQDYCWYSDGWNVPDAMCVAPKSVAAPVGAVPTAGTAGA
jgi:hypothetical protein